MTPARQPDKPALQFRGGWLTAARALWIALVGMHIVAFAISLPDYIEQYRTLSGVALEDTFISEWPGDSLQRTMDETGVPLWVFVSMGAGSELLITAAFALTAIYLFVRGGHEWMGWYTSLTLALFGLSFTYVITAPAVNDPRWYRVDHVAKTWQWTAFYVFLLIFPNGRPAPRWMRFVIAGIIVLLSIFIGNSLFGNSPIVGPLILLLFGFGIFSMVYRYIRVSGPVERLQSRWLITSILVLMLVIVLTSFGAAELIPRVREPGPAKLYFQLFRFVARPVALMLIPIALGIAIRRYRLWDIDLIIRRTLTYGAITLLLGLIYFGGVIGLQALFSRIAGGESPLAIVATTLLIAALFAPLRRRVQSFIDRRFYRQKYDAARTLDAFSATLYEEVDIEILQESLVSAVTKTMQPEHVSLWLASASAASPRLRERGS